MNRPEFLSDDGTPKAGWVTFLMTVVTFTSVNVGMFNTHIPFNRALAFSIILGLLTLAMFGVWMNRKTKIDLKQMTCELEGGKEKDVTNNP